MALCRTPGKGPHIVLRPCKRARFCSGTRARRPRPVAPSSPARPAAPPAADTRAHRTRADNFVRPRTSRSGPLQAREGRDYVYQSFIARPVPGCDGGVIYCRAPCSTATGSSHVLHRRRRRPRPSAETSPGRSRGTSLRGTTQKTLETNSMVMVLALLVLSAAVGSDHRWITTGLQGVASQAICFLVLCLTDFVDI